MRVFVSYDPRRECWIKENLIATLTGGGADVLMNGEHARLDQNGIGQRDALQDKAERHVLCLSRHYLGTPSCRHEMLRAMATDPDFRHGMVVLVRLDDSPLPLALFEKFCGGNNPLLVDLRSDEAPEPWKQLLQACNAHLGVAAPAWLRARSDIGHLLTIGHSVNLVVNDDEVKWKPLVQDLPERLPSPTAVVSLENPETTTRQGLLNLILHRLGLSRTVSQCPGDLIDFKRAIESLGTPVRVVIKHFDMALQRPHYGIDLFAGLRWMTSEARSLILLLQSRRPYANLLPRDNPLSDLPMTTVRLG